MSIVEPRGAILTWCSIAATHALTAISRSCKEHVSRGSQAQFVAEAPQDYKADHIRQRLQTAKGRSRPFVKSTLTGATAKAAVPQRSPIGALGRGRRVARGTPHLTPSFRRGESTPSAGSNQDGATADRTVAAAMVVHPTPGVDMAMQPRGHRVSSLRSAANPRLTYASL
jgi:hypothetical protein